MGLKRTFRRVMKSWGYEHVNPKSYNQDGLRSVHDHSFMDDPRFAAAYARGVQATKEDYHWHWRVHIGLWVAAAAAKLEGDFVECGVNKGFLSSAIMQYLDWDRLNRTFYLLDTFSGLDERFVSAREKAEGALDRNKWLESGFYVSGVESVKANFSQWRNVRIIQGAVPETLEQVQAAKVAYLHLDMNCAPPEMAAAAYFWPRLAVGGFILLDDYAYKGYKPHKDATDEFTRSKGVAVLSLPTGQGLIVKPPGPASQ